MVGWLVNAFWSVTSGALAVGFVYAFLWITERWPRKRI
jgi:hypothetical protein